MNQIADFEAISAMTANGATATSSVVAGNVCFQAVAKLTSTADIGRKAAVEIGPAYAAIHCPAGCPD